MEHPKKLVLSVLDSVHIGHNPHDEDVHGFPLGEKIWVEHLAVTDDGIFPTKRSWNAFCNGNFSRAEDAFWLEGDLKPTTVDKWVSADTRQRIKNSIYTKLNATEHVYVTHSDIELVWTYELRGCDENNYPTEVEFIVTARIKNSQ